MIIDNNKNISYSKKETDSLLLKKADTDIVEDIKTQLDSAKEELANLSTKVNENSSKNTLQDTEIANTGTVCDQIGVNESNGSTALSVAITNYKFIWIANTRSDGWNSSYMFPVAWLKDHYGQELKLEYYDGSRLRCKFNDANTFEFIAGYYSGDIYIYGIK